jgi:hypothetical protein
MARRIVAPVTWTVSACSMMVSRTERSRDFAQGGETGGSGVAVESHAMRQGILSDDLLGAAPVEVVEIDHGAIFVAADGALAGVAGEVGLGDPLAAPAENLFELHVANSFFARPPDCCGAGCLNGPDSC